jgi:hypothetical protein
MSNGKSAAIADVATNVVISVILLMAFTLWCAVAILHVIPLPSGMSMLPFPITLYLAIVLGCLVIGFVLLYCLEMFHKTVALLLIALGLGSFAAIIYFVTVPDIDYFRLWPPAWQHKVMSSSSALVITLTGCIYLLRHWLKGHRRSGGL